MVTPMTRVEFMKLVRKFGCMKVSAFQRYRSEADGGPDSDFAEFAKETAEIFEQILAEHNKLLTEVETLDASLRM